MMKLHYFKCPRISDHCAGAVIFLSAMLASILCQAQTNENFFGFRGPEIFPIDYQIDQLHAADLDGDGLIDLILVNNTRSKIELLYNQTGKTNAAAGNLRKVKREINDLPPDSRFRIDSITSEKRISCLVVADLNGDGRPDLAYYGEPKELIVQYNNGTNGWSEPQRWPISDGQLTPLAMAAGDLNGDGRTDLVLLGENSLYFLAQKEDHTLAEPVKIPFSSDVKAVQIVDVDGDGLQDLLLVNWDSPHALRIRLQDATHQLGPETYFAVPSIRSYIFEDLDGDGKPELVTIAQNSGQAQVYDLLKKAAEPLAGDFAKGQFQIVPLNRTKKAHRGLCWADLNGDGLPDLIVAEPDSGQLSLYLQKPDGTLATPRVFPTFTGVSDIAVADWDGDGTPEIFLLSEDEHQVGLTRLDKSGRIAFPTILPLEGKPLAMAVGSLKPDAKPVLAVLMDQDGKRVLSIVDSDQKPKNTKLSDSFTSNPASMAFHDVDQDGRMDLVILIPYEKIKILAQLENGTFEERDVPSPVGNLEQPWMSFADVDGDGKPELLLGQRNFIRAVVLKADKAYAGAGEGAEVAAHKGGGDTTTAKVSKGTNTHGGWSFQVKDQINGRSSNSRIVGATPLFEKGKPIATLFLLDADQKAITLCQRDSNGVWQVERNVPLPANDVDLTSLSGIALGGSGVNTLAFKGPDAVAWMRLSGSSWQLNELDGYETPIKDGHLNDVVAGDLNNDKRKELVFLETAHHYVDLVAYEAPHHLAPINRWQVFEERTFRSRRNEFAEPREALIEDVTGHGKKDLILIVHDRVLVYPQE